MKITKQYLTQVIKEELEAVMNEEDIDKVYTPKAAELNEKVKVTKDDFPYIEFEDGGEKYKVEFDQGDIIDDHGNEGKDWYYVGKDQFGNEWEIDVYTNNRDEPEDWFHDTIKIIKRKE